MKVALGSLHLSLVEAATRQIDAAIDALQSGQYDIAITLAGAAEGMIERDGSYMFVHLKNAPHVLEEFSQKEWINELNRELYWLKHGGQPTMTIECGHAAFMIARAASKLEKWTMKMEQFKEWLVNNLDAISQ
jgi:predicted alpha-1,6-mannanase (GH76 family)